MALSRSEISSRYDATHSKTYSIKLNLEYDADIIAKLDTVPNRQSYIKQLIRQDISGSVPGTESEDK